MTVWAILAALIAALCYAAGAAWQQRQAVAAPSTRVVHPGLIWQLLRRPAWLAGFGVVLVGEALHVLALAWAPVAVVQPIGVATVLFAVLLTAVADRRPPPAAQLAAAALIVAALVVLLGGMRLTDSTPTLSPRGLVELAAGVAVGVGGLAVVALRVSGTARTLVLGCGAGAAFGVSAALVRLLAHRISVDGVSGLFGWLTPVLALTAIGGLLLEQGAYKSGHLGAAVAGTTITDPLVAVLVGAWVVHQPVQLAHPVIAYLSAGALAAGVALLARCIRPAPPRTLGSDSPASTSTTAAVLEVARW